MTHEINTLKLVKLGINTQLQFVVFIQSQCPVVALEGFETLTQILVSYQEKSVVATLMLVNFPILKTDEASLSESAWQALNAESGAVIQLSHMPPLNSLKYVRAKVYGHKIDAHGYHEIIQDIVAGKYSDIHLASFITACAGNNISIEEIVHLTQAMISTGEQLHWGNAIVVDKHSVGGIPGNRTTPIVVPIIAAAGLLIPKTSSRAITSPSGTADTVETMTPVNLTTAQMRQVVEKEGGCMVWGGSIGISPADDLIIRVERPLDLDPEGQMIASVLSKKAAMGATHVMIDVPVGPTAKVRSRKAFLRLKEYFDIVGKVLGLNVETLETDGTQPIGRGIGPALEAKDILAILRNEPNAPIDLKDKAICIAGTLLEFGKKSLPGQGQTLARKIVDDGIALKKFLAICEAQGGFNEPPSSRFTHAIVAPHAGFVTEIHNRNLATVAKLAGAPHDPAAGIEIFVKPDMQVEKGELLYRIHAMTQGGLNYSLHYARSKTNIIKLRRER